MTNTQIKIYHNPRCSKSREALNLIEAKGFKAFVVEYIKNPPTYAEIKDLLMKLNLKTQQIIRTNEALYKEKFKNKNFVNLSQFNIKHMLKIQFQKRFIKSLINKR